jgi:hypothetical protein
MKNSEYKIVFSPKNIELYNFRKRFLISCNNLSKYIGKNNADTVKIKVSRFKSDKCTLKFRKYGKIEIYYK